MRRSAAVPLLSSVCSLFSPSSTELQRHHNFPFRVARMSQPRYQLVCYIFVLFTIIALFDGRVRAIEVTADSQCSNFCINSPGLNVSDIASSQTFSGDLSCLDSDYDGTNETAIGRKFRTCVSCEQNSTAVDTVNEENDVYWFLCRLIHFAAAAKLTVPVNIKSTVAWCVQGFFQDEQNPNATLANSECHAACDPIGNAIEDRLKETNETLQYNYCESNNGAFMSGVDDCSKCLYGVDNVKILGNCRCHACRKLGHMLTK